MSVSAADIPDKSFLQTVGDRRSIRYYDPDKKVEDWKIQTILQSARLASCQGNINATEAIVVERDDSDLWDEIEECVSGFNVQIINQSSHLIFWLTNLHAWYGRANDGLSTLALSGALTKYHGWNYEFTMTQTLPRLMSFPTERTENLLRFETGQAAGAATLTASALGIGSILIAFGRKPGGVEKAFGLTPNLKFTWAHAFGYPLEDFKGGGQRPRLKFSKLFHKGEYGVPFEPDGAVDAALKEKGMLQEQAPTSGRIEELDQLAAKFSRDPGVVSWPEREVKRLLADDDWDFGPNIRKRAEEVVAQGNLPDYPEEMTETFKRLLEEHNIDTTKYLG
jgi:nitroreductase